MMRRPYRAARRRRRFGRYDPSPVLLVTEDDRTLYLGSASRMLWRYRSELVPFTTALCLAVAGAWAHARHPGAAVGLAALTAASTAVLGVPPGRWPGRAGRRLVAVLDRWPVYAHRLERVYAASVVALAGAWLSAATRWGATAPPLPAVALLGTLVAGVPWWTHHRRRERVRVTRLLEAWPTFSESIGLPGSRVTSAVVDRWGWTGRLALRRGQTVAQAIAAADRIESAIGTRPGAVRVEPDPARADRAVLRVLDTDPLAAPVPWPGLPATGTTEHGRAPSILDPIELGISEDGAPVLLRLAYRNALVGGIIGSGKSGVLNVIMACLVACRDVAVWGVDLKGGMELRPWAACLGRLATTPEEAVALLRDARAERRNRATSLGDDENRTWTPRPDAPALIIVIDEFAELPEEAKRHADSIARMGRATLVNVLIATQRPTQDAMGGGAIRQQMDVRICLRVRERRDTDLILGQGYWAAGWRADLLIEPGKFLLSDPEHTTPRPARGYQITDPQVSDTAAEHSEHQPTIPDPVPDHESGDESGDTDTDAPTNPPTDTDPEETDDSYHGARRDDHEEKGWDPDEGDSDAEGRHASDPATVLWRLLSHAPPAGVTIPEMMAETRMSRPWLYLRLGQHTDAGRVTLVSRGHYRAADPGDGPLT